jgi:hypothetical protein
MVNAGIAKNGPMKIRKVSNGKPRRSGYYNGWARLQDLLEGYQLAV